MSWNSPLELAGKNGFTNLKTRKSNPNSPDWYVISTLNPRWFIRGYLSYQTTFQKHFTTQQLSFLSADFRVSYANTYFTYSHWQAVLVCPLSHHGRFIRVDAHLSSWYTHECWQYASAQPERSSDQRKWLQWPFCTYPTPNNTKVKGSSLIHNFTFGIVTVQKNKHTPYATVFFLLELTILNLMFSIFFIFWATFVRFFLTS